MGIEKRSSEFSSSNRCSKLRQMDSLNLSTEKNQNYDNAIIVKDILKGYFKGDFQISDFNDLVSQGIEDNFFTQRTGDLRKQQLVKCLQRACLSETRTPIFGEKKIITVGDGIYDVSVKPDCIFVTPTTIELVMYRAGKSKMKMKGKKRDLSPNQCLELYFLLLYGRTLLKKGETKIIKASYYYLRKTTDTKTWDNDFFSNQGDNIIYIEETETGGNTEKTDYDKIFEPQIIDFALGSECSEEECKTCSLKTLCYYQKAPEPYEKKTLANKNGKITPSNAQQEIIDFRKGVCRVNATAGSGKTECMTERGARMIEEGVHPSEILFITFTDAGAIEMKERIEKKCMARGLAVNTADINAMTFNTFAYRIVRDKYADCGFTNPPTVLDDVNNSVIITQMLEQNPVTGLDYLNFKTNTKNCKGALPCAVEVFKIIKSKNLDISNPDTLKVIEDALAIRGFLSFCNRASIWALTSMFQEYSARLIEDNMIEFADQEPFMNKILDLYPDYLNQFGYKHIIVDEFQDSNDVQLDTIKRLTQCPSFESLMVVGDDSQSIYGFRETSPENILNFFTKIGIQGKDLFLTENRRSTPEILELANKINNLNTEKVDKAMVSTRPSGLKPIVSGFYSKDEEYDFIVNAIEKHLKEGVIPEDIAIIAAKKTELVALASRLSEKGIPWIMKNPMPLSENSRVQAAISLAEAFYQPDVTSLYFNYLVAKYDGDIFDKMTVSELQDEITQLKKDIKNMDCLQIGFQRLLFHKMLNDIKGTDEVYAYFLDLVYQNEDLQSELEYIQNFKKFGEKVAKKMEQSYSGIVLTTAHSSKGLEWSIVFNTISEYDSLFLHVRKRIKEIEEKRRLLFVSMTRARDILYVTGRYVTCVNQQEQIYNQFLREVMEAANVAYVPIDPLADIKKLEKQNQKTKEKIEQATKKMSQQKKYQTKQSMKSVMATTPTTIQKKKSLLV